ncbi:MAG: nuclear transport factor 2 family protein [Dongiaceae bacterium]
MPDTRDLIGRIYTAFNAHDIDRALTAMSADVDWPNAIEGGYLHGQEAVRDYWTRQWNSIDPHVDPVHLAKDNLGRTVVTVHQVVRNLTGIVLKDELVQHVYDFEDGLIRAMEIHKL